MIILHSCLMAAPGWGSVFDGSVFDADILVLFPPETLPPDTSRDLASRTARAIEKRTGIPAKAIVVEPRVESEEDQRFKDSLAKLASAHTAYKELDLQTAQYLAREAEEQCLKKMSFDICRGLIFQSQMLIGMVEQALDNQEAAANAFRNAHAADPSMVLDPRRYPPLTSRAFSSACIAAKESDKIKITLQSNPEGATFRVNGADLGGKDEVHLPPGRHIITAKLLGYRPRNHITFISENGSDASSIVIELTPHTDALAFDELLQTLSQNRFDPGENSLKQLLIRFDIEYIIILQRFPDKPGYRVHGGKTGNSVILELPPIESLADPLNDTFDGELNRFFGLPVSVEEKPEQMVPKAPISKQPIEDDLEEDDESFVVRLQGSETKKEEKNEVRKILTSPWFWGSIGAAICIAGGVVLATQLD